MIYDIYHISNGLTLWSISHSDRPNLVGKIDKRSHIIKAFPPCWTRFRIFGFFWNLFRRRKIHFRSIQVYSISKNWFNSPINMNWYVFYIWDHFYNFADFRGFSTWLIFNDTVILTALVPSNHSDLLPKGFKRFPILGSVLLFLNGVKDSQTHR